MRRSRTCPRTRRCKAYVNVKALLAADPDTAGGAQGQVGRPHRDARADRSTRPRTRSRSTTRCGPTPRGCPTRTCRSRAAPRRRRCSSARRARGGRARAARPVAGDRLRRWRPRRSIDPAGYAEFQAGKEAIGRRLGIDVDEDVLAQLTGDVSAAVDIDGKFGVRAELEDADAFEETLAKVMERPARVLRRRHRDQAEDGRPLLRRSRPSDGKSYAVGVGERRARGGERRRRWRPRSRRASWSTPRARRARSSPRPTPSRSRTPRSRASPAGCRAWAAASSRARSATCSRRPRRRPTA